MWWIAATALAGSSRFEPACTCIVTEDVAGTRMDGAVPLDRVAALIHDRGDAGPPGLYVRLDNGREIAADLGDAAAVSPVAQEILARRNVPIVHTDGSQCPDLGDLPPDRDPGDWWAVLRSFAGNGQDVKAVALVLESRAKELQKCLPPDLQRTATPVSLDFSVTAVGDLGKVTVFSLDLDDKASECVARQIGTWRTAGVMAGPGHYAFDVQLPGKPIHSHPGP